jgi:hypothetical protein
LLEALHCFRRVRQDVKRSAYASAGLTFLMGLLVESAPVLADTALALLLGVSFVIDAFQRAVELRRGQDRRTALTIMLAIAANLAMAGLVLALWKTSENWTIALAGALRIVGVGWNMVMSPLPTRDTETIIQNFGLPDHPDMIRLAERLAREETARRPYDRRWIVAIVAILFATHVGRTGSSRRPSSARRGCSTGYSDTIWSGAFESGSASIRCATRCHWSSSAACRWACRSSRCSWPRCPSGG